MKGVSYINAFPVGETSWARQTPVGETSRSRCNRATRLPRLRRQKVPFIVGRGPVPRQRSRPRTPRSRRTGPRATGKITPPSHRRARALALPGRNRDQEVSPTGSYGDRARLPNLNPTRGWCRHNFHLLRVLHLGRKQAFGHRWGAPGKSRDAHH